MKAGYSILLVLMALLASCDRMSSLTYKVRNMGADSIRIFTVRKDGAALIPDTFKISYNETITIGTADKGFEHVSNYKQTGAVIEDFQSIIIQKVGSGTSAKTNFLQSSLWSYNEKSAHMADEILTVKDSDF